MRTCVPMSIKGSPYARFRRALDAGHLDQIRDAATELPMVKLDDALSICCLMARKGSPAFERASVRWTARLILERPWVGVTEARTALALLQAMPEDPDGSRNALMALARLV